jgi:hypothetical protein
MIREINKDIISFSGGKNFTSVDSGGISSEDGEESSGGNLGSFIINVNTSVDIFSFTGGIGLVENLTFERILTVVCNIVVGEDNNVFGRDTVIKKKVV